MSPHDVPKFLGFVNIERKKNRKTFFFLALKKLCDNFFNPFWKSTKSERKTYRKAGKNTFFLSLRFEGESSRLLNLIKMQSSILRSAWQQQQHKRWQNNEKLFRDLVSNLGAFSGERENEIPAIKS